MVRLSLVVLCCLATGLAIGQTLEDAFARGNQLYREGRYEAAAKEYEAILQQGYVSASLLHNLGNSYFRLGRTARAILAYERAARLSPNDREIQHNLTLANFRTVDRIEPLPELFFMQWFRTVATFVSHQTSLQLFGGAWAFFFVSLSLFFLSTRDSLLRLFRLAAVTSFLFVIVFGGMVLSQVTLLESQEAAIIVAPVVTVKSSPDPQSVDAFVIHEGLRVRVDDSVGEWQKITLADGKVGWIRTHELEVI